MNNDIKAFHHVALSVSDISKSQEFYGKLGFQEALRWQADNHSLAIVQLKLDTVMLELIEYAENTNPDPSQPATPHNTTRIGLKHIGLRVADVTAAFEEIKQNGYTIRDSEVKHGRTGIDYFFVQDPDGMWVEIVQDDRGL